VVCDAWLCLPAWKGIESARFWSEIGGIGCGRERDRTLRAGLWAGSRVCWLDFFAKGGWTMMRMRLIEAEESAADGSLMVETVWVGLALEERLGCAFVLPLVAVSDSEVGRRGLRLGSERRTVRHWCGQSPRVVGHWCALWGV
jgi:hypothetical protein